MHRLTPLLVAIFVLCIMLVALSALNAPVWALAAVGVPFWVLIVVFLIAYAKLLKAELKN